LPVPQLLRQAADSIQCSAAALPDAPLGYASGPATRR